MHGDRAEDHIVLRECRRRSDLPAVIHPSGTLAWRELGERIHELAIGLLDIGLQPGQSVVLDIRPSPDTIALFWACWFSGLIVLPLSARLPVNAIQETMERAGAVVRIFDGSRAVPGIQSIAIESLQGPQSGDHFLLHDLDRPATIMATSGSSGRPKLVVHSLANHFSNAQGSETVIPLTQDDRWLLSLPLDHVAGLSLLFRTFRQSASLIIPAPDESLSQNLVRTRPTHVSLVATQLQRLLDDPDKPLEQIELKALLLGGGPIPHELMERSIEAELPIHLSYGSTEMASQICTTRVQAAVDSESVGKALPGRDILISHEGEILTRGDCLALGYWEENRLVPCTDEDGWFHTRDLGYLDVRQTLTITGRMDNQFISGGENIQPEIIERELLRHPSVSLALVVPEVDAEFGFRPVAFLRGRISAASELDALLRRKLPGFMAPRAYYALPERFAEQGLKPDRQALIRHLGQQKNSLQVLS